ncbi:MAG TPA: ATP-binding cassette domain-containing protein [Prolixibacteraceae bacterium]|nr:ATP-binding cassette domain-containing protein [Prolixibacteraceae bacterium]
MMIDWNNCKIQIRTRVILSEINLQLQQGESLAIIGANSSGKTVLAKALAGLLPAMGDIQKSVSADNVVYVAFQSGFTLKHGTSAYRQQRWNMFDKEVVPTVRDEFSVVKNRDELGFLIDKFEFHDRLDRLVISLSNGEQRKLELIKALAQKPRLLVIDNTFNGLDTASRKLLNGMLNQLVENGQSLVLTGLKTDDFPESFERFVCLENQKVCISNRENIPNLYQPLIDHNIQIPHWENSTLEQLIAINNLDLKYGDQFILKNINWTVNKSDKWVLSGGNGSGKTSLLNMIFADNPKAYACDISLFGKPKGSGESIWEIKEQIGFVSPEMHQYLPPRQKVSDVLCSGFFGSEGLYRKPTTFQRNLAQQWLNTVGLKSFSEHAFGTLSASLQRMVLVLRTLVKNPPLLLLDEPFQGLDSINIQIMKNLLNAIARQTSCAMIFVSHFDDEIPEAFNFELRLNKGEMVFSGER